MKPTQKRILLNCVCALAMLFGLAISIHAQLQPETIEQIVTAARVEAALDPITNKTIPVFSSSNAVSGTFWGVQSEDSPPWPFMPFPDLDVVTVDAAKGIYLMDDRSVDYSGLNQMLATEQSSQLSGTRSFMTMDDVSLDPNDPGDGSGTNGVPYEPMELLSFDTNGLWLEVSSNALSIPDQFSATLHNTIAGQPYEILTNSDLGVPSGWAVAATIMASGDSITVQLPMDGSTNLFAKARFAGDSDQGGLPDWWQLKYFAHLGVDPYGLDSSGDGWNTLQDFQNGFVPGTFNTPPAPTGVHARLDTSGNAVLSWQPAQGDVTGYTITRFDFQTDQYTSYTVGLATGFVDTNFVSSPAWDDPPIYYVYANYSQDYSSPSSPVSPNPKSSESTPMIVPGPGGSWQLVVSGIPAEAVELELTRVDWAVSGSYTEEGSETYTIPISAAANGPYTIPASAIKFGTDGSSWYVCTVYSDGQKSQDNFAGYATIQSAEIPVYFNDGSDPLVQNAVFLLRAAGLNGPFEYSYDAGYGDSPVIQPTNYVYASFYNMNANTGDGLGLYSSLDWPLPFEENYRLRNFAFSTDVLDSAGFLNTGCQSDYSLVVPYDFQFPSGSTNGLPSVLGANETTWIVPFENAGDLGVTVSGNQFSLSNNVRNYFGLSLLSVKVAHNNSGTLQIDTLTPGGTLSKTSDTYYFYPEFEQPELATVGYYFGRTENNIAYSQDYLGLTKDPLPGNLDFSPTNPQPVVVASVGQPLLLAAFSEQIVLNGDTTKPVYISQYFDKAYKVDANGAVTSQETGILSPYGIFFPTEPGPVALVTMPDQNGQRGTNIVHVVKLQLDVNHDGKMDLSYWGKDSADGDDRSNPFGTPFTFWANNDCDRGHDVDCVPAVGCDYEQDDLGIKDISSLPVEEQVPDYLYTTNGSPAIPSTRDLEDYARLWIPGLTSLMQSLPPNYQVQLFTKDVPLRIFRAVEADGGTNYLFDEVTASNQVANSASLYLGKAQLSWQPQLVLNGQTNLSDYFIFCGTDAGKVNLALQIVDTSKSPYGGNVVLSTTAFIKITDIKDMYERWTVGERPKYPPGTATQRAVDDLPNAERVPFQYPPDTATNTPYILFVHGWNMETWEKDTYAETSFKRLYWQGYQGRFGVFRWPTDNDFGPVGSGSKNTVVNDPQNYDRSESNAWASATGLVNELADLDSKYPGNVYLMAHSMGNVAAGEALRLAGTNQVANTYIAMQAAVPAHCYDPTTPIRTGETNLPPNRYAEYPTDNGPSYFNGSAGAGAYINFYNPKDYALSPLLWQLDQNTKPDVGYGYDFVSQEFFRGTFSTTTLSFPQNTYEIFAYCDPARSYALGAQANVEGAFQKGGSPQQIDLSSSPYNFKEQHKYHSGQFRADNMQRGSVWRQVIISYDLQP